MIDRSYEQVCPQCGEHPTLADSRWRWNGEFWEHHHGYPVGHVTAVWPERPIVEGGIVWEQ